MPAIVLRDHVNVVHIRLATFDTEHLVTLQLYNEQAVSQHCGVRSGATPAVEVIAVSARGTPQPGHHPRKPLLGLRRKPGRLALAIFRMPLHAYRHDAGWLLGHTFLEFVHTGRKTGQRYETVAMVLRHHAHTREAVICVGWGPDTDWVRNLRAGAGSPGAARARVVHPAAPVPLR